MPRTVLPNHSARAEWLFAGVIDRPLHHWGRVPALDGGPGDHDLDDSETDTATPDDDNVSLASYTYESVWPSSLSNCPICPVLVGMLSAGDGSPT